MRFRHALWINVVVIETADELPLVLSHGDEAHEVALTEKGHDIEKVYLVVKAPVGFIACFDVFLLFFVPVCTFFATAEAPNKIVKDIIVISELEMRSSLKFFNKLRALRDLFSIFFLKACCIESLDERAFKVKLLITSYAEINQTVEQRVKTSQETKHQLNCGAPVYIFFSLI